MGVFTRETKIGDIVVELPQASSILKANRIDFCCGGDRPLGVALDERQVDGEKIIQQLNQLREDTADAKESVVRWEQQSSQSLIEHIVKTHHEYLRQELPELAFFVKKILNVHGSNHPELEQVYEDFDQLKTELEDHIDIEEKSVFPALLAIEQETDAEKKKALTDMILKMEDEHQKAGEILFALRDITSDYALPGDACNSYRLTYTKLKELEADLFQHIHLENNILFPRVLS